MHLHPMYMQWCFLVQSPGHLHRPGPKAHMHTPLSLSRALALGPSPAMRMAAALHPATHHPLQKSPNELLGTTPTPCLRDLHMFCMWPFYQGPQHPVLASVVNSDTLPGIQRASLDAASENYMRAQSGAVCEWMRFKSAAQQQLGGGCRGVGEGVLLGSTRILKK